MRATMRGFLLALIFTGCTNALVDPKPRLYACDRAEGLDSCPGNWRCGLSGYCQNPDQALPYTCETSADCSPTWHCGAERLCFDRAAALDRSCRASLESVPDAGDCAPGWRCGREVRGQVCHPLDAGAPYQCTGDSDCEAGWRCGPEGVCVDVAKQGLRPGEVMFNVAKVSPLLPTAAEALYLRVLGGSVLGTNRMLFTADGGLHLATNSNSPFTPHEASLDSTPLLRPAHALVETNGYVLVSDSSGVVDYRDALDGGTPQAFPGLANAEFRYAKPVRNSQEELAAFSGSAVALCGRRSSSFADCDPSDLGPVTLPATVNDVVFIDELSNGRRAALAATSDGPYFAPRTTNAGAGFVGLDGGPSTLPVWRPMALPGLSTCTNRTPIERLAYEPARHVLAVTTEQDRRLSVFSHLQATQSISACADLDFVPLYGPCQACGAGEVLVKLGLQEGTPFNDNGFIALCRRDAVDAGAATVVSYKHRSLDGGCGLEPVGLPAAVSRGYQVPQQTSGLQGLDSIGVPRSCPFADCANMISTTAPDRVAGGPGVLATYNDDYFSANGDPVTPPSAISSRFGMRSASYFLLYVAGSVVENPDWMISSTARTGTQGGQSMAVQPMYRKLVGAAPVVQYAVFSRSFDLLPAAGTGDMLVDSTGTKSFSTITTDADGLPWLIVGAGDRIWATDSRLIVEDAGVHTIGIKAVPSPSADIQSLAFAAFDRGDAGTGPLLQGYTVEQQRLFSVLVHTPTLWLSDEIRLGQTNTVPLAVWMEGGLGRVGTSDGRVFGLPVPVVLSTTIPEGPMPTVLGYGSLCGQAFALSSRKLYRLSLDAPPLGNWKEVSLESAQAGLDGFGPHWAPVVHKARVGNQEHLYLFSHTGLVVELVATCP